MKRDIIRSFKQRISFFIALLFILITLSSCNKDGCPGDYDVSPNGLCYKVLVDNKQPKSQPGEYISFHVFWRTMKDSLLFSSENSKQPLISLVARPIYKGDLWEIFTFLGEGDSASAQVPARNVFKAYLPPNMKADDLMKVDLKVISVMSQEKYDSVMMAKANAALIKEDQDLQDYARINNLNATKTPTGLYVVMEKEGSGPQAANGNTVRVEYRGTLLNGTEFDSSMDPGEEGYEFVLGTNPVIQGWVEGLTYFKKGGKGKLLIPSRLGYSERGNPPKIGPNEPLIFDIELVEVK